jgi:hypothetical protein
MLKESFQDKRQKQRVFQSLFLSNGRRQEVMVLEDEYIDFGEVQKHLDNGGSVFITSKNCQKLRLDDQGQSKSRRLKRKEPN